MANPQANKFTRISNELFDSYIRISRFLSPYESTIWLCILRKTYGFNKKNDWISLSQIELITGILQPHIARTKKKLLLKNMIVSTTHNVGIQKDYEAWNIPKQVYKDKENIPKQVIPKQVYNENIPKQALPKQVSLPLPKQVDTKDIDKDIIYGEDKSPSPTNDVFVYFCQEFEKAFGKIYIATFAKDKKILKDLLNFKTAEEVKELIDMFFKSNDEFISNAGYTVGVFKSQINKLGMVYDPYRNQV